MASIETDRDDDLPEPGPADDTPARRLLRFRAAGEACVCELMAVLEIVRARAMARLPGAAPWVPGIMNVRGRLLTVVDLSARLNPAIGKGPALVVVVEGAGRRFGLGVESVQGVAELGADEPTPGTSGARAVGEQVLFGGDIGAARWCDIDSIARESLAG